MMNFESVQPCSEQMQHQEKVGDDKKRVDRQLNGKSSHGRGDFLFHPKWLIYYPLTCQRYLVVACNHVKAQIVLHRERFFLAFHFTLREKPWPMQRTNTPKTYQVNSMSMINASIAICAAKPRLPIASGTMTAAIPTFRNNRRRRKKKDFARRRWKAVRSKRWATTARRW